MRRIDWEFEKAVLADCWEDLPFRVFTLVIVLGLIAMVVLTLVGFVGWHEWFILLGSAIFTFTLLQLVRR